MLEFGVIDTYIPVVYFIPLSFTFQCYLDISIWGSLSIEVILVIAGSILTIVKTPWQIRSVSKIRLFGDLLIAVGTILMLVPLIDEAITIGWNEVLIGMLILPCIALFAGFLALAGLRAGGILTFNNNRYLGCLHSST